MPIAVKGPAGNIECLWEECSGAKSAGLICHPHPLYGGSMYDAVVDSIGRAMMACNLSVLRFNFRGVGASEGKHDRGEGEASDVNCLLDWIRDDRNIPSIYLAGYSFGALVALNAASIWPGQISQLFLVAPPIGYQSVPQSLPCPVTVIAGDQDQVIDQDALNNWVECAGVEQDYHVIPGADHFLTGFHTELEGLVAGKLKQPGRGQV